MIKIDLYKTSGEKSGKIELPKKIFEAKINEPLMAQAVRVYLSNQRLALAQAQTRSEVNRTKAKWYRQKGTGRARHGARSAPIFVGGGKAHGPVAEQNFKLNLSKKLKKQALFSALSKKAKDDQIMVIKGLQKIEPKTKKMFEVLGKLKLKGKICLVLPTKVETILRSGKNIKNLNLAQASLLNTYEVLNGGKILLMEESLETLKKTFLDDNQQIKKVLKNITKK